MTYRAKPVTQRDGSPLANSNCLMAAAAVGLDYHTLGKKTSTGAKMRNYSGDTSGGTNTDEIERAWHTGYDEDPVTRDGKPFGSVIEDLEAGRCVMLQVWHATVGKVCLSGSGAYGHGITVAPERDGSRWLVADPWCSPPKWAWVEESKLEAGAEQWVQRAAREAAGGGPGDPYPDPGSIPLVLLVAAARRLMDRYRPGHPHPVDAPPGVGGGPGVLFASTRVQQEADVSIDTGGAQPITTGRLCDIPADTPFYDDPDLQRQLGGVGKARTGVTVIGAPTSNGKARAVVIDTSKPYDDGVQRPTVVYVKESVISTYPAPPGDTAARDKQWRDWLEGDADAPDR